MIALFLAPLLAHGAHHEPDYDRSVRQHKERDEEITEYRLRTQHEYVTAPDGSVKQAIYKERLDKLNRHSADPDEQEEIIDDDQRADGDPDDDE